eukprot:TRINITY_DN17183_c0_g2_i1.p1 TRINITY_DN17183_c0_g2~~TRINITY_DN17183_c0_g2_i1.p1  ORF type:complete len:991 (-),score=104.18 TRINITY_DN17183_c0_g2_i1:47-3019(-)
MINSSRGRPRAIKRGVSFDSKPPEETHYEAVELDSSDTGEEANDAAGEHADAGESDEDILRVSDASTNARLLAKKNAAGRAAPEEEHPSPAGSSTNLMLRLAAEAMSGNMQTPEREEESAVAAALRRARQSLSTKENAPVQKSELDQGGRDGVSVFLQRLRQPREDNTPSTTPSPTPPPVAATKRRERKVEAVDDVSPGDKAHDAVSFWHEGGGGKDWQMLKPKIKQVLLAIFEFYAPEGQPVSQVRLTSTRFQRMAIDANIVDNVLTTAKVDVVFHAVCESGFHMTKPRFLDAIVKLVVIKYPAMEKDVGMMKMYNDHFACFSDGGAHTLKGVSESSITIVAASRQSLRLLYEGYFRQEVRQHDESASGNRGSGSALVANSNRDSQASWAQMCGDFDVTPPVEDRNGHDKRQRERASLVPKAIAHSVYREVMRSRKIPESVQRTILGDMPALGVNFTYLHFCLALLLIAQRCFGLEGAASLIKLFEWMDSSRGNVAFRGNHTGRLQSGVAINVRLMPEKLPDDILAETATEETNTKRMPASASVGSEHKRVNRPRDTSVVGEASRAESVVGKVSKSVEQKQEQLSASARHGIWKVFAHYAGMGDSESRHPSLDIDRFYRFLRDVGLLSSDTPSRGKSSPLEDCFTPPRRSNSCSRESGVKNSENRGGRRSSTQCSMSPARTRAGRTDSVENGLPLCIFEAPILKVSQADLIFAHAARESERAGTRGDGSGRGGFGGISTSGGRRSSFTDIKRSNPSPRVAGASGADQSPKSGTLSPDGFMRTLVEVASRCRLPCTSRMSNLEAFCGKVIKPLQKVIVGDREDEMAAAGLLSETDDITHALSRCEAGLSRIFRRYAKPHVGGGVLLQWSHDSMIRFARDFGIANEISTLDLQRIYRYCIQYDFCKAARMRLEPEDGQFTIPTLRLALVVMSQTLGQEGRHTPKERVFVFLSRLNSSARAAGFDVGEGSCAGSLFDPLLFAGVNGGISATE